MIIGINGKIGAGKDTVGKIIQYLTLPGTRGEYIGFQTYDDFTLERNSSFKIKKFAGKLKTTASLLTGVPVEMFEDQEFKKLDMNPEWGMTYREFLQKLGTEAMRDGLHTNVWVNALFADYHPTPNKSMDESFMEQFVTGRSEIHYALPKWIITDMRFPNEMEAVKERKGITIRVVRPHGYTNPHTGEYKEMPLSYHSSETALDDSKFDYEIINNGEIEDLVEKVKEILIKENII